MGPVLPHTHTHTCSQRQASSPRLARLKVTRGRRRMCGLQPLKCPREAKEPFVSSEELRRPGVSPETGGAETPGDAFIKTGWPFVAAQRECTRRQQGGPLDANSSWQAPRSQKKSLKRCRQAESVLRGEFDFPNDQGFVEYYC